MSLINQFAELKHFHYLIVTKEDLGGRTSYRVTVVFLAPSGLEVPYETYEYFATPEEAMSSLLEDFGPEEEEFIEDWKGLEDARRKRNSHSY